MEHLKPIQVATLLHVIGKECVEMFSNFVWTSEEDRDKIEAVEDRFNAHCAPLTSRHFKEKADGERKEFRENVASCPYCRNKQTAHDQSLEKTLQAADIAETSKQHIRSLKEESGRVEKVDVVGG